MNTNFETMTREELEEVIADLTQRIGWCKSAEKREAELLVSKGHEIYRTNLVKHKARRVELQNLRTAARKVLHSL